MGKLFRKVGIKSSLTTGIEVLLLAILLGGIGYGLYEFAPGLKTEESKQLEALVVDGKTLDNVTKVSMLPLATKTPSTKVVSLPQVTIAGYAWNAQTTIYGANGDAFTTKGSLMEQYDVNLRLVRQDWLTELSTMQMNFIQEYDSGVKYPDGDRTAFAIMIMGDGAPYYISTRQKAIDDKFGKGKYHLQVIGAIGMSDGEDKLIGPLEWKTNPSSMLGSLISTVPGDGDWVTTLNYCFANKLKVNPDFTTYDPNAVNFFPSKDDDYINSAKELIASQTEGFSVTLKEVIDGKLTGKSVSKIIDGCATWTPGDKMVFDALSGFTDVASTADFPNQMATTLIAVKEWCVENPQTVSNILKGALTSANQMKQHDQWRRRGAQAIADGFDLEDADYWYDMYDGQTGIKDGVPYSVGGSRPLTYADALQYYGVTDGVNRYKSVYNQVSTYLTDMNPFGFNEAVDRVVPYNEAVNLYFLKNINDIDAGTVSKVDYTETKTKTLASGQWNINFATGSNNIQSSSNNDLETIYNLLIQAEQTKLSVIGHTDNTGSDNVNVPLSKSRAESVVEYLLNRGIPTDRIQLVDGKGSIEPVASNSKALGRAKNRRVQITLLQ
tara:strand:+ start:7788 stop:9614 length:1827 start_codon:yes stop_codon:yes gene_type:complete